MDSLLKGGGGRGEARTEESVAGPPGIWEGFIETLRGVGCHPMVPWGVASLRGGLQRVPEGGSVAQPRAATRELRGPGCRRH